MLYRICLLMLLFCCWESKAQENEPASGKGISMKTGSNLKCICRGLHLPEYDKGIKDYYFERHSSVTPEKRDNYESTKVKGNGKKCWCFEYGEQHRKNGRDSFLYVKDDGQQIDKYDVATDRPSERLGGGQVEYRRGFGYSLSGKSMYNAVSHRPFGYPINGLDILVDKQLHPATGHSLASDKKTDFAYGYPIVGEKLVGLKASDYPTRDVGKVIVRRYGRHGPLAEWNENYEDRSHPMIYDDGISDAKENLEDDGNGWRKDENVKQDKYEIVSREKREADFEQPSAAKMVLKQVLTGTSPADELKRKLNDSTRGDIFKEIPRQGKPFLRQKRKSELEKSNGDKMNLEESTKDIVNSVVKQDDNIVAFNKNKSAEILEKIGFGLGMASEVAQQAGSQAGSVPFGGKMAQSVLSQVSGGLVVASNAANTIAEQKRSNGRRRKRSLDVSDSETFDNSTNPRIAADNIIKISKRSTPQRQTTTRTMNVQNRSSSSSTRYSAGLR